MPQNNRQVVLFFIPSFEGGGAEKVMITVANEMADRGQSVVICVGNGEGPYRKLIAANITLVDCESPRLRSSFKPLVRCLKTYQPDVIYSTIIEANIAVSWARKLARVDSRLVLREAISSQFLLGLGPLYYRCLKLVAKRVYQGADAIVSVSNGVETDLIEFLDTTRDERFWVIYNPANPDIADLVNMPAEWGKKRPHNPRYIVTMGRLSPQKGFDILLKALQLVQKTTDIDLVILGEGELRTELESLASQLSLRNVHFLGFRENPYPILQQASVFVLSSNFEGMPNALIDAMALNIPVVSTNCPTGPDEILENGKWGTLVDVGDYQALAQGILKALTISNVSHYPPESSSRFSLNHVVDDYMAAGNLL